ncbi:hypothetical protein PV08_00547 [Exophiala spinifera]|uniref:Uncharacterized protein n=1 Tax=Exophiala spinifera TaxID=91928 RepID=A0A0D2A5C6_9EURO|nr:uncharacterized protein PV08_00547 [Exophiala spinifera]KIW19972.1 hypothetical protein PV08_00547 [Exophiala spinifera]
MRSNPGINPSTFARIKHRTWNLPTALVLIWGIVLLWGERFTYGNSVQRCLWQKWESWPTHARPHHVLLVADPQLVDPHTYPDRPWPLSALTVAYTDRYLRRSYGYLQDKLRPDATLFLGDLFDGGREWGTVESTSPEERYKKYGTSFWMKEYMRFSDMFLRSWYKGQFASQAEPEGRRILASLPGNHDLGFAAGIQLPVKERFDAYFGPMNRIDIIGNHSFVHLDTVSLSAMDQIDPETGSSGAGDGSAAATASSRIWTPVEEFLRNARTTRDKAIRHVCETRFNWPSSSASALQRRRLLTPSIRSAAEPSSEEDGSGQQYSHPKVSSSQFPTILLSHVPLFRSGTTSCGPKRERGTSIPLSAGYQYQNVLTPLISQDIVKHLTAEEIAMIYSGDDHDYCEIEHSEFTGRIREITVKSISWAMGIRHPAVQLVSLWNPVAQDAVFPSADSAADQATPRDTVQNRLCLLPDQLGVFIRYAQVMGLTLLALAVHAVRHGRPGSGGGVATASERHNRSEPLLPITRDVDRGRGEGEADVQSSCSSVRKDRENVATTRKMGSSYAYGGGLSRPASPSKPQFDSDDDGDDDEEDNWGVPRSMKRRLRTRHAGSGRVRFFANSVRRVAVRVVLFYIWLIWTG